jgi:hypothetical protein
MFSEKRCSVLGRIVSAVLLHCHHLSAKNNGKYFARVLEFRLPEIFHQNAVLREFLQQHCLTLIFALKGHFQILQC